MGRAGLYEVVTCCPPPTWGETLQPSKNWLARLTSYHIRNLQTQRNEQTISRQGIVHVSSSRHVCTCRHPGTCTSLSIITSKDNRALTLLSASVYDASLLSSPRHHRTALDKNLQTKRSLTHPQPLQALKSTHRRRLRPQLYQENSLWSSSEPQHAR